MCSFTLNRWRSFCLACTSVSLINENINFLAWFQHVVQHPRSVNNWRINFGCFFLPFFFVMKINFSDTKRIYFTSIMLGLRQFALAIVSRWIMVEFHVDTSHTNANRCQACCFHILTHKMVELCIGMYCFFSTLSYSH